ncbi:MAG TPA: DUF3566 domain-containing protein [Candidatus Acidoferrum sp.]|nr:DUF3566 domain-containing protein [Candidatus Acidoferrum sp.]
MRYELKSIGLWAFVKISFFMNLILGFIMGLLYALFFSFIVTVLSRFPGISNNDLDAKSFPVGIMVIFLPILFAILGAFFNTVIGAVVVFLYNAIARMAGGFELEFEPMAIMVPSTPPPGSYQPPIYAQTPPAPSTPPPPPPFRPSQGEPPAPPSDMPSGGGL